MSVTTFVQRQARPGQAAALLALAQERLAAPRHPQEQRAQTQVFQSGTDPHRLLWVSTWTDAEAYWARSDALGGFSRLDALSVPPTERLFCQRLALYENMQRPPAVVNCGLLQAREGAADEVLAYLHTHVGPALRRLPGLILRAVYQDQDTPERICTIAGQDSPATLSRYEQDLQSELQAHWRADGVRVTSFIGLMRGHVDRYSSMTGPAPPV